MPRFFFHIANGDCVPDAEGSELPDLAAARETALTGAREMIAEELKQGKDLSLEDRIEIEDEAGRIVAVVTFKEAMGLPGQME